MELIVKSWLFFTKVFSQTRNSKDKIYGHSLNAVLQQSEQLTGKGPQTATVARGYPGKKQVGHPQIICQSNPLKRQANIRKERSGNIVTGEPLLNR